MLLKAAISTDETLHGPGNSSLLCFGDRDSLPVKGRIITFLRVLGMGQFSGA